MSDEARYPIQMAARRSGLTPHVIRVWERRYGVINPTRGQAARRLYSDADVERLSRLREATAAGHPISTVAQLDAAELDRLLVKADSAKRAAFSREVDAGTPFRDEALEAVKQLNATALKESFQRAVVALGHQGILQVVIAPLADEIGVHWRNGTISAAHEHFFVAAAKMFLG